MRSVLARLLTWLALAGLYVTPVSAQTWDSLLSTIRRRFPGIRQLSPGDLADWLAATNRPAPVLVDAREPAEFAVSHLAGARNARTVDEIRALPLPPTQPIVLYCSVGYRSSALAERLSKAGFTHVANLEASLFAWANQGRPVYRGPERVDVVHPYDAHWGRLLDRRWHPPASAGPDPDRQPK